MEDVIAAVVEKDVNERLATGPVEGTEVQLRTSYYDSRDAWKVTATASNGVRETSDYVSASEAERMFEELVEEYGLMVVR